MVEITTALYNIITKPPTPVVSSPQYDIGLLHSLADHPQLYILLDLLLAITTTTTSATSSSVSSSCNSNSTTRISVSSNSSSSSDSIAIVILKTIAIVVSSDHTTPILILVS